MPGTLVNRGVEGLFHGPDEEALNLPVVLRPEASQDDFGRRARRVPFSTDMAGLVANRLSRFVTLNRHQLAGQVAILGPDGKPQPFSMIHYQALAAELEALADVRLAAEGRSGEGMAERFSRHLCLPLRGNHYGR
jgi:hypothetical protein